jgi:hypothetical protein
VKEQGQLGRLDRVLVQDELVLDDRASSGIELELVEERRDRAVVERSSGGGRIGRVERL